jgi:hypothetical protein
MTTTMEGRGAPTRADVQFCRVAALAAVWGAVLVPGALLAGYNLFFVQGLSDRLPLALVAGAVAGGIALMIIGRRIAARLNPAAGIPDRPDERIAGTTGGITQRAA